MLSLPLLQTRAEDGHDLWLRMDYIGRAAVATSCTTETADIAAQQIRAYWNGDKAELIIDSSLPAGDGFKIEKTADAVRISSSSDKGLLYGAFDLLRRQQCGEPQTAAFQQPRFRLRMLNHWDNLDGSIERGYAGKSIWKWEKMDDMSSEMTTLFRDYAKANASIGINATVLNNVNTQPEILTAPYINKVKKVADIFRPYGIQVFLSVNFGSPKAVGGLDTADPLDQRVRQWWKDKADEIYAAIPDFGGFLVKANSEGQPGPGDYDRSHADGANMLAEALKPHGGIVIWRSFVYGHKHKDEDRVMQAVTEFKPLDGEFAENVILQSKNGPLDFQPREPYSPVFDQIKKTKQGAELQITQEYTGQSKHLVYLAPMWKEFFSYVSPDSLELLAGVSNIGDDRNWCGHPFSQSNWYAFGRLAWDPSLSSEEIAREWVKQTFINNRLFVDRIVVMMESSREACVDYMMPLGLHHIFKFDHHYGPEPDGFKAEYPIEWCPVYYHKADSIGVGFERSSKGSNAVSQYRKPYSQIYNDIRRCPENLLLWFHHVPWNHKMKSGRTLWEEMNVHYNKGVDDVAGYIDTWNSMRGYVDKERGDKVAELLHIQYDNAKEWRDTCLKYFGTFANKGNKK